MLPFRTSGWTKPSEAQPPLELAMRYRSARANFEPRVEQTDSERGTVASFIIPPRYEGDQLVQDLVVGLSRLALSSASRSRVSGVSCTVVIIGNA